MEIEKAFPSLNLCMELPEGYFPDSAFVHVERFRNGFCLDCQLEVMSRERAECEDDYRILCPAPTLAEIVEKMPKSFEATVTCIYHLGQWEVEYYHKLEGVRKTSYDNDNPAEAALKVLLELIHEEDRDKEV